MFVEPTGVEYSRVGYLLHIFIWFTMEENNMNPDHTAFDLVQSHLGPYCLHYRL